MNFPEAIAFSALMLGLIVFAGIWLDAYNTRVKARTKELELKVRMTEAEGRAGGARLGEMEHRLRVLERIATDKRHLLADEIEALRAPELPRETAQ